MSDETTVQSPSSGEPSSLGTTTATSIPETAVQTQAPPAPSDGVSQETSIADSVPADPELEAKPGFQNLRTSYQKRVEELQAVRAELDSLKSQAPQVESYVPIDAPVEDWNVGQHLDALRDNDATAPYYNKLAWEVIERHLPDALPLMLDNPQLLSGDFARLAEQTAISILQQYTGGMSPEEIGAALRAYQAQYGYAPQSYVPQYGGQTPSPNVDMNQLAYQYGLDPAQPGHAALLQQIAAQHREMQQLRSSVNELTSKDEARLAQSGRQQLSDQIDSYKTNLLSKVQVPPGYEYVTGELNDRVTWAFENDPVVRAAKADLEKFYLQGTPDLTAAKAKQAILQNRLAHHFKEISERRLGEIRELESLKTRTSQTQAGVRNVPPGAGTTVTPTPAGRSNVTLTPENVPDIAVQRFRDAKLGRSS